MKQVHLQNGKTFDSNQLNGLVIGGQNGADTIRFVIPRTYAEEVDLSTDDWSFYITYENVEDESDTVLLEKSVSTQSDKNLYLDWQPGLSATRVSGKLECQVYGYRKTKDDEDASRLTFAPFAIYIPRWINPTVTAEGLPTVIEQALEIMAEYNADIQQALESGEVAVENAHLAERYAKGTEDGEPVESGPGYQDNAKYYLELTREAKTDALDAIDARTTEKKSEIDSYVEDTSKPAIDSHVTQKQSAFDSHVAEKTSEAEQAISDYVEGTSKPAIDSHVTQKQSAFDSHVAEKTSEAEQAISGYVEQTSKPAIDSHVAQKQSAFDSHVAEKTEAAEQAISDYVEGTSKPAIDNHVAQKQTAFDSHVAEKTEEATQAISGYVEQTSKPAIDSHVSQKQSAFDSHVVDKQNEFDAWIEEHYEGLVFVQTDYPPVIADDSNSEEEV